MALIKLLDISGIFYPVWHIQSARGDVGSAASETVRILRERAADGGADFVVACCDTGRSFRHEIAKQFKTRDPEYKGYKGNRPEKDAALFAALDRVIDNLEQDGVPIMRADGFEADDVIATLTKWAVENGHDVEIVSEDKDLCALIRDADPDDNGAPSVVVVRKDGERVNADGCIKRLGVPPDRVPHMLALVGDDSDNIPGIHGIAKVNAARILWGWTDKEGWKSSPFKTFDDVVSAAVEDQADIEASVREIEIAKRHKEVHALAKKKTPDAEIASTLKLTVDQVVRLKEVPPPARLPEPHKPRFSEAVRKGIITQAENYDLGLQLTTLRFDVPLDFAAVTAPRVPKPKAPAADLTSVFDEPDNEQQEPTVQPITDAEYAPSSNETPPPAAAPAPPPVSAAPMTSPPLEQVAQAVVVTAQRPQKPQTQALTVVRPYELQLEPATFGEADKLADFISASRMFKDIESKAQALIKVAVGRSIGLNLMQSLTMLHVMEGKITMAAQLVVARVRQHPNCEYFRKVKGDDKSATWESKKRDEDRVMTWTFTIQHAKDAKLGGIWNKDKKVFREDFDPESNWTKYRPQMLSWRAALFLARDEWAEVTAGIYDPDEIREQRAAPSLEAT